MIATLLKALAVLTCKVLLQYELLVMIQWMTKRKISIFQTAKDGTAEPIQTVDQLIESFALLLKSRLLSALLIAALAIYKHTEAICLLPLVGLAGQVTFTIQYFGNFITHYYYMTKATL